MKFNSNEGANKRPILTQPDERNTSEVRKSQIVKNSKLTENRPESISSGDIGMLKFMQH